VLLAPSRLWVSALRRSSTLVGASFVLVAAACEREGRQYRDDGDNQEKARAAVHEASTEGR
jgi:hypothetical protein